MRFSAKKNAGCPKAPHDFPPRKDAILHPRRIVLGLFSPSPIVCMVGRAGGRAGARTLTSRPKFLGSIGYQICLAMVLLWRDMCAWSAKSQELKSTTFISGLKAAEGRGSFCFIFDSFFFFLFVFCFIFFQLFGHFIIFACKD